MDDALDVLVRYGYVVVFGWVFAEQIGLPIPAVPVLLAAGALAGGGRLSLTLVLVLAALASLVSDTIWYWIGRTGGGRVLGWLCRISLEPDSCAKFVPGFSTAAPPLAGVIRMSVPRFVVFTGLGGVIWAGAFVGLGWLFSAQLEAVVGYVARLGTSAVALLAAGLGAYVLWKYVARHRFLRRIRIARITPEELKAGLDAGEDLMIVDVRHPIDFDSEPAIIPGALHMTTEELEARHHEIPRNRDIVLYCT